MSTKENKVLVWDPFIRFFHWGLVLSFLLVWVSAEENMIIHEKVGYFMLSLIGLRIIWGFIGAKYARFSNFIYSPNNTLAYLRSLITQSPEHYTGHNPAGGWMVVLLLVGLIASALSGIQVAESNESIWEEFHEVVANLTMLLVMIHIAGVVVSSFIHHENLLFGMLSGKKSEEQ